MPPSWLHRCWLSPRSLKGLAKAAKKTAILHPGQEKGRFPRGLAHDEESKFYFKAIHHAAAAAAPAFTVYTWLYTPFYVLFPRRAFFSLFIFCTVKSFFPSFFLHKGEDFVLFICVWGESSPPTALMKAKEKGLSYCYCLFVILHKGWFSKTLYSSSSPNIFEFRQICFKHHFYGW